MRVDELTKMIAVKKMDLEECEWELNSRYYPSVVRVAMTQYISELKQQIDKYHDDLINL